MRKSFYYYWFATTAASLADVIYIMVITTFIYLKTNSPLLAALFPFFRALAKLAAGFISPLILERLSLKKLFSSLQFTKAVLLTILIIFFDLITSDTAVLLLFVVLVAFLEGLAAPLTDSVLPRVVAKENLIRANSLLSVSSQSVQIAGFTFTGLFVVQFGHTPALIGTAILLWLASFNFYLISKSINSEKIVVNRKSRWEVLKEGWLIIWRNHTVRIVTVMDMIEGIAGAIWVGAITLVYVKDVLHKSEDWWGYINSSYYIGTIAGGFFTLWMAKKIQSHLILSMAIGSALFSILTLMYGLTSIPIVALILCVAMGPAYQLRDVAQQTALQTNIDLDILPKVYASRSILLSTISSISIALVGLIAEILGIRWVYVFGALLIAASAVLSFTIVGRKKNAEMKNEAGSKTY
jgi:MFS family permease